MKKEEIVYLEELLEVCERKLDNLVKFYDFNNSSKFSELKKEIVDVMEKISKI